MYKLTRSGMCVYYKQWSYKTSFLIYRDLGDRISTSIQWNLFCFVKSRKIIWNSSHDFIMHNSLVIYTM